MVICYNPTGSQSERHCFGYASALFLRVLTEAALRIRRICIEIFSQKRIQNLGLIDPDPHYFIECFFFF
jgi:hypothetical protein